LVAGNVILDVEAEEVVDFFLVEHAVGAAARRVELGVVVVDHRRPLGGHGVGVLDALLLERGAPLGGEIVHVVAAVGALLRPEPRPSPPRDRRRQPCSTSLLHDDVLEEHVIDTGRIDRDVDPPLQFFLEAEQTGRP
jgi:hypothetical protein